MWNWIKYQVEIGTVWVFVAVAWIVLMMIALGTYIGLALS